MPLHGCTSIHGPLAKSKSVAGMPFTLAARACMPITVETPATTTFRPREHGGFQDISSMRMAFVGSRARMQVRATRDAHIESSYRTCCYFEIGSISWEFSSMDETRLAR